MKVWLSVGIVVILLCAVYGVYTFIATKHTVNEQDTEPAATQFSDTEFGLSFTYKSGADGYVLDEPLVDSELGGPVKILVLPNADAVKAKEQPPQGGEGSATITILIFENSEDTSLLNWVTEHPLYSNIELKMGDIQTSVIAGKNAIRYMIDGLYASEVVLISHNQHIYVFSGAFIDRNSPLRSDFLELVDTISFLEVQ